MLKEELEKKILEIAEKNQILDQLLGKYYETDPDQPILEYLLERLDELADRKIVESVNARETANQCIQISKMITQLIPDESETKKLKTQE